MIVRRDSHHLPLLGPVERVGNLMNSNSSPKDHGSYRLDFCIRMPHSRFAKKQLDCALAQSLMTTPPGRLEREKLQ